MPRNADLMREAMLVLKICLMANEREMPMAKKCEQIEELRKNPEISAYITQTLLSEIISQRKQVVTIKKTHDELGAVHKAIEEELKRLTAPPLFLATFLRHETVMGEQRAIVSRNNSPQCVNIAKDFDSSFLQTGDEVLLSSDRNILVAQVTGSFFNWGETAIFNRHAPDGRLIVTRRDEEIVINCCKSLCDSELNKGDRIRINETAGLAYEKMDRPTGDDFFLKAMPNVTFDQVGGLDSQIAEIKDRILLCFEKPETARKYGLSLPKSLLLLGPPGVGKTMVFSAMANMVGTLSESGNARVINVKPGQLGSMWYSQTEANIREVFRAAREAAYSQPGLPVIMFFDEIDSIGARRGGYFNRVDDRVFDAFAVELEGLEERGNIFVVGATNRLDILDIALVRNGRLGDWVIHVPRPNRNGARAILGKYFHEDMPYEMNGCDSEAARNEIIESALSMLYSTNGESDITTIMYRDGEKRVVKARELISGAALAKLARDSAHHAALRDRATGQTGIQLQDVFASITQEFEHFGRMLTPTNCRHHLDDLRQDVDVVSVEPIKRSSTARTYRYLNVEYTG